MPQIKGKKVLLGKPLSPGWFSDQPHAAAPGLGGGYEIQVWISSVLYVRFLLSVLHHNMEFIRCILQRNQKQKMYSLWFFVLFLNVCFSCPVTATYFMMHSEGQASPAPSEQLTPSWWHQLSIQPRRGSVLHHQTAPRHATMPSEIPQLTDHRWGTVPTRRVLPHSLKTLQQQS